MAPPASPHSRSPCQLAGISVPAPAWLGSSSPSYALGTAEPGPPAAQWGAPGLPPGALLPGWAGGMGPGHHSLPRQSPPAGAPLLLDSASRGTPGTHGILTSGAHCTVLTPPTARQCSHWSLKICTRGHPHWSQLLGTSPSGTRARLLHCTQAVMCDSEVSAAPALGTQSSHCWVMTCKWS